MSAVTDSGDVGAVMAKFPGPVMLYADKKNLRFILIAFAVIEFGLVKALFSAASGRVLVGIVILVLIFLWGLGSTAFMFLSRNALALTLDREGFAINGLFRPRRSAWNEVGDFAASKNRYLASVTYNDRKLRAGIFQRVMCGYRRLRTGRDTALPDTYGLDGERLAQLMALWQQRALASHS